MDAAGVGGIAAPTNPDVPLLSTDRLFLRPWRTQDREFFIEMNADPRVMEFMPRTLSRDQSNQFIERIEAHFEKYGFGLCAAEHRASGAFLGFIGLWVPQFAAPFKPAVEIGWRLASAWWGQGLATEGAREIVRYAFEDLELPQLVSFTMPANVRSRRVMEKLEMTHDSSDDFDHPNLPPGSTSRRHVLYRLRRSG